MRTAPLRMDDALLGKSGTRLPDACSRGSGELLISVHNAVSTARKEHWSTLRR
jgi:hypothetical protein